MSRGGSIIYLLVGSVEHCRQVNEVGRNQFLKNFQFLFFCLDLLLSVSYAVLLRCVHLVLRERNLWMRVVT